MGGGGPQEACSASPLGSPGQRSSSREARKNAFSGLHKKRMYSNILLIHSNILLMLDHTNYTCYLYIYILHILEYKTYTLEYTSYILEYTTYTYQKYLKILLIQYTYYLYNYCMLNSKSTIYLLQINKFYSFKKKILLSHNTKSYSKYNNAHKQ